MRATRGAGLRPRSGEEGNFELASRSPRGGPGAASRVTSLTTSYGRWALQNNGRNRILPSCPASRRLLRQTPKHNNIAGPSLPAAQGGDGSRSSCRGSRSSSRQPPPLPALTDLTALTAVFIDVSRRLRPPPVFQKAPISPLGKQRSKQLPHAELSRLWRKFTLHIIRLFACT